MITLVCTKCGNTLHVDDGFAGGVCRCSACGTIQTVPKRGQQQANGQQAIFERATRNGTCKDLEALSDIVTSSGLVGSGVLRQSRKSAAAQLEEIEQRRKFAPIAVGLGAILAAVAVGLWLALGMGRSAEKTDTNVATPDVVAPTTPSAPTPVVAIKGPAFGPIALDSQGTVIYLVDRGDATRAYTEPLQRAVAKSVATLGPSRKFQVRYWTADAESPAFPTTPGEATPAAIAKLNVWMADVPGGRATDATASLDDALAAKPAEIVILTGKAWQLDDSFANAAIVKLGTMSGTAGKVRIHGIALGGTGGSDALSRVCAKTGGRCVEMDESTLAGIAK